jgi:hypothetical protein
MIQCGITFANLLLRRFNHFNSLTTVQLHTYHVQNRRERERERETERREEKRREELVLMFL